MCCRYEKKHLALDAELHSDLEYLLIENGSIAKKLWGINIYPELKDEDFFEFYSLTNIHIFPPHIPKVHTVPKVHIRDEGTKPLNINYKYFIYTFSKSLNLLLDT